MNLLDKIQKTYEDHVPTHIQILGEIVAIVAHSIGIVSADCEINPVSPSAIEAIISAAAAAISAVFAGVAWWSWRSQFRMQFPYVEAFCQRGENALLVYWSMEGSSADDWSVDSVRLRGKSGQFATYHVRQQPERGREYVQDPQPAGRNFNAPRSPLCIIEAEQVTAVVVEFRLRSKAHQRLRQKRRMTLRVGR